MSNKVISQPPHGPIPVVDVHTITQQSFGDFVRNNPQVLVFLSAPATFYETALSGGERDGTTLHLLHLSDAVQFEAKHCLANPDDCWSRLDQTLYNFLGFSSRAACKLIPKVVNNLQQKLLDKEWYELMPAYQCIRQHIEFVLPNQNQTF